MKPGTQIIYIPNHADRDPNHPDCELGFVTAECRELNSHFCRYWRTGMAGKELRTTANSESTPNENLEEWPILPQAEIDSWIQMLYFPQKKEER